MLWRALGVSVDVGFDVRVGVGVGVGVAVGVKDFILKATYLNIFSFLFYVFIFLICCMALTILIIFIFVTRLPCINMREEYLYNAAFVILLQYYYQR